MKSAKPTYIKLYWANAPVVKERYRSKRANFLLYLEQLLMINVSRCISFGRMTRFMGGRPGNRGSIVVSGYSFCSFPKDSDRLGGPPRFQWVPRAAYPGVKRPEGLRLTTHLQLALSLRMNGALLLLPHTPSWSGLRKLFIFKSLKCVIERICRHIWKWKPCMFLQSMYLVFSQQRSQAGPSKVYKLCSLWGTKLIFVHNIDLFHRGVSVSIPEHCVWDLWWTQWHRDRLSSEYFSFPPSISFLKCSILIFFYTLLVPEGPTGETWEPWE